MTATPIDAILTEFGIGPEALIGEGRKSLVYAIDDHRMLRILRYGGDVATLTGLKAALADIDGRTAIATPLIDRIGPDGLYTVERLLPGVSLTDRLENLTSARRQTALANAIAAAGALATVKYPDRPYGQFLGPAPIRTDTWPEYFRRSLDRALKRNGAVIAAEVGDIEDLRAKALALIGPLEVRPPKALVHGDYFAANVLMDDALAVTGIVDFSSYTLVGDPHYDMLTAPMFLEAAPHATPPDVEVASAMVRARLGGVSAPVARFYRAHAAFTMANPVYAAEPYPKLYAWSLENLRHLARDTLPLRF